MDVEPALLGEPDRDEADSLVSSNDPDDMANEQTWPTEEEMDEPAGQSFGEHIPDAKQGTTPKAVRRLPKGTSEYQAAWIVDESDDEGEDGVVGNDEGRNGEAEEEMVEMAMHDDDEDMEIEDRKSAAFQDLDMEEEDRQ